MPRSAGLVLLGLAFQAACLPLCAQEAPPEAPVYGGRTLYSATTWEGEGGPAGGSLSAQNRLGIRTSLIVSGFPLPFLRGSNLPGRIEPSWGAALRAGYRWTAGSESAAGEPFAGIALSAPFAAAGPFRFEAETAVDFSAVDYFAGFGAEASAGIRTSIRLAGRDYIAITPSVSTGFAGKSGVRFSLAIGTRREKEWLVPARPANVSIAVSPAFYSPDDDGYADAVRIRLDAEQPRAVERWQADIRTADGTVLHSFTGSDDLPELLEWSGRTAPDGSEFDPGDVLEISMEISDSAGRDYRADAQIIVDILLVKEGSRYKIRVPDILFSAYSADVSGSGSKELLEANRAVLTRIAELFTRFPDYSLVVEGHANAEHWQDQAKAAREQEKDLIPLSKKRAETVKAALVRLGIAEARITTAGYGASFPIADFADEKNKGKNRRVEFILERTK